MNYFYEVFETEKGWKWRIEDETGKLLKASSGQFHSKDDANFIAKMWAKQMFGIEVNEKLH